MNEGFQTISFQQLDVSNKASVADFASWISQEYGHVDILVNNAGTNGVYVDEIYVKENNMKLEDLLGFIVEYESAKACVETNYYGAKHVIGALLPLLRSSSRGARIINVGFYLDNFMPSKLQQELEDLDHLSEALIDQPLKFPSYKMSKIALHAYTRLLATQLEKDVPKVFVNCVHLGFVRTDITSGMGNISAQEGAENIVRVALLPPNECPSGQLFLEKKVGQF
ncbi:hypothetical protein KP509_30G026400 [Ceratopteris richardii]|uniref:Uncharacterized protein n=1 Tax=Ceratopteris richardii TaxID=49495 RepID=A0A8T2R2Z0_CERRI|nr:hypothetical protein KP509_30G026400 [Ceratopteris richardii]